MAADIAAAAEMLAGARRILAFTGAGISTESGIPDFRGPGGIWTKVDPAEFTISRYVANPDTRRRWWKARFGLEAPKPNPAHTALVDLWHGGLLIGCVTQNIDGLHLAAGLPQPALVEVHGNLRGVICLGCGATPPVADVRDRVLGGDDDPKCGECGGILKATVVFFEEMMPQLEMARAFDWAGTADAVIAVGSTLSVYPAAHVPLEAAQRGVPYLIVNRGETDHDTIADLKLEGAAGTLLPELVAALLAKGA